VSQLLVTPPSGLGLLAMARTAMAEDWFHARCQELGWPLTKYQPQHTIRGCKHTGRPVAWRLLCTIDFKVGAPTYLWIRILRLEVRISGLTATAVDLPQWTRCQSGTYSLMAGLLLATTTTAHPSISQPPAADLETVPTNHKSLLHHGGE